MGATGDRITAAEFREMQGKPKAPVQGPAAPKGKQQWALGRLPQGVMNKTEERFLNQYVKPHELAGGIIWWDFGGLKLRLAPNTFLTVDFTLLWSTRELWLVDVKGAAHLVEEDARVKLKVAADRWPFKFHLAWPVGKRAWHIEQVGRA